MAFTVVCISRTLGAGGEVIGQSVAQRLGFRYVDEQIIARAAAQAQVDPHLVAAVEHRAPLLRRVLANIPTLRDLAGPVTLATGLPLDALRSGAGRHGPMSADLQVLIRAAILEIASGGGAVIVAHAASMAVAGRDGVLRVLVTASPATRAERVAAAEATSAATAAATVAASDRERCDYFLDFYKIKEELPTHYDIVINTDVLQAERAIHIIMSVAQGRR